MSRMLRRAFAMGRTPVGGVVLTSYFFFTQAIFFNPPNWAQPTHVHWMDGAHRRERAASITILEHVKMIRLYDAAYMSACLVQLQDIYPERERESAASVRVLSPRYSRILYRQVVQEDTRILARDSFAPAHQLLPCR